MAAPRKAYLDEAAKMYAAGLSLASIGDHYGKTRQSMWKAMRRRGVALRSKVKLKEDNHFFRGGARAVRRVARLVERAVQIGALKKPSVCSRCKKSDRFSDGRSNIQAHHDDYNRPLDVRWLCQRCHHRWHQTNAAVPFKEER